MRSSRQKHQCRWLVLVAATVSLSAANLAAQQAPVVVSDSTLGTPRRLAPPRGAQAVPLRIRPVRANNDTAVAEAFFRSYAALYRLTGPENEFRVRSVTVDAGSVAAVGMRHVRMQQEYRGLEIFGAEVIVHLDREFRVLTASGRSVATPGIATAPRLVADSASRLADAGMTRPLVVERSGQGLPEVATRLGVFIPALFSLPSSAPRLAYRIERLGFVSYVDAESGDILLSYDNIKTTRNRKTYDAMASNALPGTLRLTESQDGCGVANYDLMSPADRALVLDYDGDSRQDLFLYRPGRGAAWVARSNGDGTFTATYAVGDDGPGQPNGLAGYDLLSPADRGLAFDYNGDGKQDLFLYRPGRGAAWVARSNGDGTFTAVHAVGDNGSAQPNGLAGYDLLSPADQVLTLDYDGDGKQDLFFYRPGRGAAWVARSNGDGTFTAVYAVGDNGPAQPNGLAGYDLLSPADRVLAFDYNGDGKQDLFFYRPGLGAAWVARSNGDGTFTAVYAVGDNGSAQPNGLAGYDLLSAADQALVFDYNGDGKQDLFFYRPGRGTAWVASSNGDGSFTAVHAVGDNGAAQPNGLAGYDLLSPADRALAMDYNGDGKQDLFFYRPGRGAAWVAGSNGDGSFTAVSAVGDNGPALPNGLAGYDLLSVSDQALVLDFNGDGRQEFFFYRAGRGAALTARSNGDGSFAVAATPAQSGAEECLAHLYAGWVYDYYAGTHGRDSYDDAGATLISSVNVQPGTTVWRNASWNGTQMKYGKGFAAALDVVGHEFTHALTENTANLTYANQSGALNESYSDVFGALIEGENWRIGENLPIGAIRDLCAPASFGQPDHLSGYLQTTADNGGVHTNSGIPNRAACLIAEGGTHRNITVTGIGREKLGLIYYRTLTEHLGSSSQLLDAGTESEQACKDLATAAIGGIVTADCTEVRNAFRAVGIITP